MYQKPMSANDSQVVGPRLGIASDEYFDVPSHVNNYE